MAGEVYWIVHQHRPADRFEADHQRSIAQRSLVRAGDRLAKRTIDIVLSATALLALAPLMLAIAAAICIFDGRPFVISHRRLGKNGRPFGCLKFRTMVRGADAMLGRHLQQDPRARLEWQQRQKLADDPRVTWFGRHLRAASLDELPQLINVLKGEMSLVGPRPIIAEEVARYGTRFSHCFSVAPGMTGLWQIQRHSTPTYDDRIALDASYVTRRGILFDLSILARTIPAAFNRHRAQ